MVLAFKSQYIGLWVILFKVQYDVVSPHDSGSVANGARKTQHEKDRVDETLAGSA